MNPLVSIIITSYNREKVILDTLNAIYNQTYTNWECFIIDDYSIDKTTTIINTYIKNDQRFKLIVNSKNIGCGPSKNIGLSLVNGKYIYILDSDDIIGENKIFTQVMFLESNLDVDICYTGARYFYTNDVQKYIFGNNNFLIQYEITKFDTSLTKTFSIRNPFVVGALLYRKEVFDKIGKFDNDLLLYEDWDHNIRCAKNNLVFHYLGYNPSIATYIRIHNNSMISNANNTNKFYYMILNKHKEIIEYSINKTTDYKLIKNYFPPTLIRFFKKIYCYIKSK